ncbi:MAG: helix-turn-helix transcriptional regulator, partial [Pseudomonadota bacterium]
MAQYLTTREVADLLRLKERKVYDLAASGAIPCSKATGKLLFPRSAIEAWLAAHMSGVPESGIPDSGAPSGGAPASWSEAAQAVVARSPPLADAGQGWTASNRTGQTTARPPVILGSHDPLLEWALKESQCGLATLFDGSADGLARFEGGEGVATALHLYDVDRDTWNVDAVRAITTASARQSGLDPVLLAFAKRQRGLLIAPHAASTIKGIGNLKGRRVAARQAGAGAQALLPTLLARAGLTLADVTLTAPLRSEADAVAALVDGAADATFGLESYARHYALGFVALMEERFDLLVDRRAYFEPALQRFFTFCRGKARANAALSR